MPEYWDSYFDGPFLDSDMELDREMRDHPSGQVYPKYTATCPVCGRGMRSGSYLELLPGSENGLKVCSTCRFWSARLNHSEELRRPIK
jgi:C4-type Zn-finger protein